MEKFTFDFSGIELLFTIISQLEQDHEVNDEVWNQLFNTPGYIALTKTEFSQTFFKEKYKLAFMPSKRNELNECLNKDDYARKYLIHYLKVKDYKDELINHINELKSSDLINQTLDLTFHYLPNNKKYEIPTIAFVLFDLDARGYQTVVVDCLLSLTLKDQLPLILAHELHHHLRNQILSFSYDQIKSEDIDIVYILDQIVHEGIADLIDKNELYYMEPIKSELINQAQKYKRFVEESPKDIHDMDIIMQKIYKKIGDRKELCVELRQIPKLNGHPLGYFMASTILEYTDLQSLIETTNNPFAFFELYNHYAPKLRFSLDAMNLIHDLERKYIK